MMGKYGNVYHINYLNAVQIVRTEVPILHRHVYLMDKSFRESYNEKIAAFLRNQEEE